MPSQNSQAENTPTVIITIGDSRELKWQKRILIKNPKTNQYNWVIDKTWKKVMKLGNCSILIVNPLDERPARDPKSSVMIQYQHGGVNVGGSSFSIGFAFRCATSLQSYDVSNKATQEKVHPVFDNDDLRKKFDNGKYYRLYCTFIIKSVKEINLTQTL